MEETKEKKKTKKEELEKLEGQNKLLEEEVLKAKAELINYRKRKDEETNKMLKYAEEDIILQLLPILDNFERAIDMKNKPTEEINNFLEGFKLIYDQIKEILNGFEVKEIESLDKPFDPNFHHSVTIGKDETKEDGIVLNVLQKGYLYKDKVIRPSMVMVNDRK